jgi:hypothetical protein
LFLRQTSLGRISHAVTFFLCFYVHSIRSALYNGGAGCRLCNPDDKEAMFAAEQLGGMGKSLVVWEQKFEEMLKQCSYTAFHNANKCDIFMTPATTIQDDAAAVEVVAVVDEDGGDEQRPKLRGSSIMMNDAAAYFEKKQGGTTMATY